MLYLQKCALLLAGVALVAAPSMAAQKTATSINVTTVIYDYDTASPQNKLLTRSDDFYNEYQQATYTTISSGKNQSMTSLVFSNSIWQLYIGNQTVRKVYVTLSQPVPGAAPATQPAPDGLYYANVEVYSRCFDSNNTEIGFQAIPPGTANSRCAFGIDFASGSTKYKLVMGPTWQGTGLATVTCNGGRGATCTDWTIVPNTTASNAKVATLFYFGKSGNLVPIGQYYNTYRVHVTNP